MTEPMDESVLNEEPTHPVEIENMSDDRLAELLGDNVGVQLETSDDGEAKLDAKESGNCSMSDRGSVEAASKPEENGDGLEVHRVEEEMETDEGVLLNDDEEIVEEIIPPVEQILIAEEAEVTSEAPVEAGAPAPPESSISRKRSIAVIDPDPSPAAKRIGRRMPTYLPARRLAYKLLTQLLGNYDHSLKDLEVLSKISTFQKNRINRTMLEENENIRQENARLRDELRQEKLAHNTTKQHMFQMNQHMAGMRDQMKSLKSLLTQPPTPDAQDTLFGLRMDQYRKEAGQHQLYAAQQPKIEPVVVGRNMQRFAREMEPEYSAQRQPHTSQRQQYQPPPPRQQQQNPQHQAQIRRQQVIQNVIHKIRQNGLPTGIDPIITPQRARQMHQQSRIQHQQAQLQQMRQAQHIQQMQQNVHQVDPSQQWTSITTSSSTSLGHMQTSPEVYPKMLMDNTENSRISLNVPWISRDRVVPMRNRGQPGLPDFLKNRAPSAQIKVSINSSFEDFREIWQIGGRIQYDMQHDENKTIQLLVQVSSLKSAIYGMVNRLQCNWGTSNVMECIVGKAHRFRINFHKEQIMPIGDRVTVIAIIRNNLFNTTEFSAPAYLDLS